MLATLPAFTQTNITLLAEIARGLRRPDRGVRECVHFARRAKALRTAAKELVSKRSGEPSSIG